LIRGRRGESGRETARAAGAKVGGRPRVAGAWERGGMSSATISAAAQRFARSAVSLIFAARSLVKSKSLAPATRVRPPISRAGARWKWARETTSGQFFKAIRRFLWGRCLEAAPCGAALDDRAARFPARDLSVARRAHGNESAGPKGRMWGRCRRAGSTVARRAHGQSPRGDNRRAIRKLTRRKAPRSGIVIKGSDAPFSIPRMRSRTLPASERLPAKRRPDAGGRRQGLRFDEQTRG
jgi:hypothetical protein